MSRQPTSIDVTDTTDTAEDEELDILELRPERADNNVRLDRFVARAVPELSRSYVQQLIEDGNILVDGLARRPAFKMTQGEVVTVSVPPPADFDLEPEDIPLDVVYEDADVLVIDKPAGMVAHPAPGHSRGTVVNAVLAHAPDMAINGTRRPGIVHRLDKDTSGLMVIAKSDRAQASLAQQWQDRTVQKQYIALVVGAVDEEEASIDAPIARDPKNRQRMAAVRNGRDALTHFTVRRRFADAMLLEIQIDTGRTHQIRVHLAFIGNPVVGDPVYGDRRSARLAEALGLQRQFLHASLLGFRLPGGKRMTFTAPLPADLAAALASPAIQSVETDA